MRKTLNALDTSDVPRQQTLLLVRAGFIRIGESLHGWSRQHGYQPQNVRAALLGTWKGPKAAKLTMQVEQYLKHRGVAI
jgi:hypothetical protein